MLVPLEVDPRKTSAEDHNSNTKPFEKHAENLFFVRCEPENWILCSPGKKILNAEENSE